MRLVQRRCFNALSVSLKILTSYGAEFQNPKGTYFVSCCLSENFMPLTHHFLLIFSQRADSRLACIRDRHAEEQPWDDELKLR